MKIQKDYEKRGLQVFTVAKDKPQNAEKAIKDKKINFFVSIAQSAIDEYGINKYPTIFVLSPEGKIAQGPFHSMAMITTALMDAWIKGKDVRPKTITEKLDPALKSAVDAYNKGTYGAAFQEATKAKEAEGATDAVKANADYVLTLVDHWVQKSSNKIKELEESREYVELFEVLKTSQKNFKGHSLANEAAEKEKTLKADQNVKKEVKALEQFDALKAKLKAAKNDAQKKGVKEELDALAEKDDGTRAAEKARELSASVVIDK
ncbi:MAG: redoxin domain-containing protein [Planctomycetaceae bacterium]|nr:redoxin domain-containing protein [Planctomycetaceae bacterium]